MGILYKTLYTGEIFFVPGWIFDTNREYADSIGLLVVPIC